MTLTEVGGKEVALKPEKVPSFFGGPLPELTSVPKQTERLSVRALFRWLGHTPGQPQPEPFEDGTTGGEAWEPTDNVPEEVVEEH